MGNGELVIKFLPPLFPLPCSHNFFAKNHKFSPQIGKAFAMLRKRN